MLQAIAPGQKLAHYGLKAKSNLLPTVSMDCKLRMALEEVYIMTWKSYEIQIFILSTKYYWNEATPIVYVLSLVAFPRAE